MSSRCDVLVCTLEFQSIWTVREPRKRVFVRTIFLGGNQPGPLELYIVRTETSTSLRSTPFSMVCRPVPAPEGMTP